MIDILEADDYGCSEQGSRKFLAVIECKNRYENASRVCMGYTPLIDTHFTNKSLEISSHLSCNHFCTLLTSDIILFMEHLSDTSHISCRTTENGLIVI